MGLKKIDLQIAGGIARITLDDTENHNTVDAGFTRELAQAAIRCESYPTVKVVVLAANGPVFSFGGDLKEFIAKRRLDSTGAILFSEDWLLAVVTQLGFSGQSERSPSFCPRLVGRDPVQLIDINAMLVIKLITDGFNLIS